MNNIMTIRFKNKSKKTFLQCFKLQTYLICQNILKYQTHVNNMIKI